MLMLLPNSTMRAPETVMREQPDAHGLAPYQSPRLSVLGDIRSLTCGGSPGIGDSGGSFIERPFSYYGGYDKVP
jgi:hypothetical protein